MRLSAKREPESVDLGDKLGDVVANVGAFIAVGRKFFLFAYTEVLAVRPRCGIKVLDCQTCGMTDATVVVESSHRRL